MVPRASILLHEIEHCESERCLLANGPTGEGRDHMPQGNPSLLLRVSHVVVFVVLAGSQQIQIDDGPTELYMYSPAGSACPGIVQGCHAREICLSSQLCT